LYKIIKLNPQNPNLTEIKRIGKILRSGKIIVFPTDTVYGIGCDPYNIESINKIYEIKNRKKEKGLPVLVSNFNRLNNFALIDETAKILIRKFWPGQLTLILNKVEKIPKILTGGKNTIAVRQPNNLIANLISNELKCGGIIGSSANISGEKEPITINEAIDQFKNKIDYYIDSGVSEKKVPSTILDLTKKPPILIREGPISFESIKNIIEINSNLNKNGGHN